MPAIYTRGGDTLNENILLKIFAFDDSASDARTPCIARGWDAVRRGPPVLICPHNASWTVGVNGIAISPDNTTLVVGRNLGFDCFLSPAGYRHEEVLYDTRTGERRHEELLPRHRACHVRCVSFSPDGNSIAVGSSMGLVVYSATGGNPRRTIVRGDDMTVGPREISRRELDLFGLGTGIRKTEFSPDGSLLAVVGSNSNVALYDTATATPRLIPRP